MPIQRVTHSAPEARFACIMTSAEPAEQSHITHLSICSHHLVSQCLGATNTSVSVDRSAALSLSACWLLSLLLTNIAGLCTDPSASLQHRATLSLSLYQLGRKRCAWCRKVGLEVLPLGKAGKMLLQRARWLSQAGVTTTLLAALELPDLSEPALLQGLERWLAPWLAGVRSMAQLSTLDWRHVLG